MRFELGKEAAVCSCRCKCHSTEEAKIHKAYLGSSVYVGIKDPVESGSPC